MRLRARVDGQRVAIDVADEGAGVALAMFEELRQGQGVGEGAGIGLFVCRALAEAQDGAIAAHRSTVTVTLPR